jgi:hypothetical protein
MLSEVLPQRVAVVGTVGKKSLPRDKRIEHVAGDAPVMGLVFG